MAAAGELRKLEIVDLRDVTGDALNELLEEEKLTWRSQLYWDFTPSADLVRRFIRIQALQGFALVDGDQCVGYSYYVSEEGKALIGDLYVMREYATPAAEDELLAAVLQALGSTSTLRRVEAQLMMMHGGFERNLPYSQLVTIHPRNLMVADLNDVPSLPPGRAASHYTFTNWTEDMQEEGATLIAAAYRDHVDSTINDQYRTPIGARRFLSNIVQYPGCGAFDRESSWVSLNKSGRLTGLSLASQVAESIGHITQICITPETRGTGLGYELLRRSLTSMVSAGSEKASLTVTASNLEAMRLYQRLGFRAHRRFAAYVWDRFNK